MKLAFNSNGYVKYSIEETVEHVAGMGYQGIEIARTHRVDESSEADREKFLERVKALGLEVCAIQGANPYLDREFARRRIDLAVDLECPLVSLGCGVLITEEQKREMHWKEVREALRELAAYGRDKGVKVAIEPEPPVVLAGVRGQTCERLIGRSEDAERMLADVKAENLGVLLDIGHVYVMRENVLHVIETLGERIVHVHLEDIIDRIHCHFIPGTGMVDFEGVMSALNKVGYDGFLSVELESHVDEPDRGALESIQYLGSLMYRMGLK